MLHSDLQRVSVQSARAIIVVADAGHPDISDARALRTVLALMGEDDRLHKLLGTGLQVLRRQTSPQFCRWCQLSSVNSAHF